MKTQIHIMHIIGMAAALIAPTAPAGVDDLVPRPAHVTPREGRFIFTPRTVLVADPTLPGAELTARQLAGDLAPGLGFRPEISAGPVAPETPAVRLIRNDTVAHPEGYLLSAGPEGVTIEARTSAGLFYGAQTLLQLLPPEIFMPTSLSDTVWTVPGVAIRDEPRYAWRGLMLDTCRHYFPVDYLKKYIDRLARHKMNSFHWHLTDDQAWRIEIKKHPRLTEIGAIRKESPRPGNRDEGDGTPYGPFFYTQDQIREVVAYAAERHVTILPEIEMPGHALAALAAYPELSCSGGPHEVGTRWGVYDEIFCAGQPGVYRLLEDVLLEVLELFPGPFIHVGGDEAPKKYWKTCPRCQAVIREHGLKDEHELQSYFIRHFDRFLESKGRRLIGWDEILEGGLAPGATVMAWRGIKEGLQAARAGHDVVMAPNSHCYLDYAQSKDPSEPEAIGGFLPLTTVYEFEPTPAALPAAQRRHILGVQGNLWAEYLYTPEKADTFAYPRACALAEVGWSRPEDRNFEDFHRRMQTHGRRLTALGIKFRPLDPLP